MQKFITVDQLKKEMECQTQSSNHEVGVVTVLCAPCHCVLEWVTNGLFIGITYIIFDFYYVYRKTGNFGEWKHW